LGLGSSKMSIPRQRRAIFVWYRGFVLLKLAIHGQDGVQQIDT